MNESIKKARLASNFTIENLAKSLKVSTKSIRRWEQGLPVSFKYIEPLAKVLKIKAAEIRSTAAKSITPTKINKNSKSKSSKPSHSPTIQLLPKASSKSKLPRPSVFYSVELDGNKLTLESTIKKLTKINNDMAKW
jgi:transcriptional regulator with XRE-family HTH domain